MILFFSADVWQIASRLCSTKGLPSYYIFNDMSWCQMSLSPDLIKNISQDPNYIAQFQLINSDPSMMQWDNYIARNHNACSSKIICMQHWGVHTAECSPYINTIWLHVFLKTPVVAQSIRGMKSMHRWFSPDFLATLLELSNACLLCYSLHVISPPIIWL